MERQEMLGLLPDGIPGPQTVAALEEAGYVGGIYALGKVSARDPEPAPEPVPEKPEVKTAEPTAEDIHKIMAALIAHMFNR